MVSEAALKGSLSRINRKPNCGRLFFLFTIGKNTVTCRVFAFFCVKPLFKLGSCFEIKLKIELNGKRDTPIFLYEDS